MGCHLDPVHNTHVVRIVPQKMLVTTSMLYWLVKSKHYFAEPRYQGQSIEVCHACKMAWPIGGEGPTFGDL